MDKITDYEFEWDDAKAESNVQKHGVGFREAIEVFLDPLAMARYDDDHSEEEDRWVTLGRSAEGGLLVVVHTFFEVEANSALIRIISARLATRREREQYERQ